jgi:hypothetical protein
MRTQKKTKKQRKRKSPKRPNIRWDESMRQALCCLYRFFRYDKKQTAEIFFAMFRDVLKKRGINEFVPHPVLHTQWTSMRRDGDPIWSRVHRETEFNVEGEWKNVVQRIKSTADILLLPSREKKEDDIDTTQWGRRAIASGPTECPTPMIVAVNPSSIYLD